MKIKRFEGKDMPEALRQVKEVLGPEAIILSTRTIKSPMGYSKSPGPSRVEVVAAMDPLEPSTSRVAAGFQPVSNPLLRSLQEMNQAAEDPLFAKILSVGLSSEFIQDFIREFKMVRKETSDRNVPETYQGFLRWKLMEAVDVAEPELTGTKIWAFIGPTGTGKTTTLAKLAAHFSLRFNKKITLISIDTYRIGAIEQLTTYARILRIPIFIAPDPETLKKTIANNRHQDLLLIDTAGRNPYHSTQLEELKDFLTVDERIENHLVLSATTKDADLAQNAKRFSILPIQSYIFTKIDETEEYTPLFNQLFRHKKPLSFLTNGQKVPEDIELASKGRVANLVLKMIQWN
jgi:flagellar biosynthesis protein FlhF